MFGLTGFLGALGILLGGQNNGGAVSQLNSQQPSPQIVIQIFNPQINVYTSNQSDVLIPNMYNETFVTSQSNATQLNQTLFFDELNATESVERKATTMQPSKYYYKVLCHNDKFLVLDQYQIPVCRGTSEENAEQFELAKHDDGVTFRARINGNICAPDVTNYVICNGEHRGMFKVQETNDGVEIICPNGNLLSGEGGRWSMSCNAYFKSDEQRFKLVKV